MQLGVGLNDFNTKLSRAAREETFVICAREFRKISAPTIKATELIIIIGTFDVANSAPEEI